MSSLDAGGCSGSPWLRVCTGGLKGVVSGCRVLGHEGGGCSEVSQELQAQLSHAPTVPGRLLGSFLSLSPEYTFVLEDEGGPCGFAAGALHAEGFLEQRDSSWLPAIRHKYPPELGTEGPALGQVRGHLEQRGAGDGQVERVPSLVLVSRRMPWRKQCFSSTQGRWLCPSRC